ncbi:Uu.00g066710.m01.CDS01 [Anthostomella pinea]|uniref:Uu.00g066710.m01.CDS01 n=1 Tax=Anthostomella pinea TaxID=933095 RepID=A0AAI8YNF2_9PEZI|nr:Uu.00g066710.m01.CDS01 [Anthostomella pinea]
MLFIILLFAAAAKAVPLTKRQAPSGVPSYVTEYAPIVYLYSADPYRPSDIGAQLSNTQPQVNTTLISDAPSPLTLDNLNSLNALGGPDVYLTSIVDITTNPSYLYGVGPTDNETEGVVSTAVIVNDHGSGLVDVFYMYFYAFNYGGDYFSFIVGDHVGDWEHNMVRFQDGTPTAVWYSQHSNGEAFTYETVQKSGVRPIVFSANGSHANYAISGTHDHTIPDVNLPEGPIEDYTDEGPIWDPTLSAYYYTYDADTSTFAAYDDSTPVNWLYFTGHWGDDEYPENDPRQSDIFGIDGTQKYTGGPTGPEDKQLNRTDVCPDNGDACILRVVLGP